MIERKREATQRFHELLRSLVNAMLAEKTQFASFCLGLAPG
jgi:hypothetical protein